MRVGRRVGLGLWHSFWGHPVDQLTLVRSIEGRGVRLGEEHVLFLCSGCGCVVQLLHSDTEGSQA